MRHTISDENVKGRRGTAVALQQESVDRPLGCRQPLIFRSSVDARTRGSKHPWQEQHERDAAARWQGVAYPGRALALVKDGDGGEAVREAAV